MHGEKKHLLFAAIVRINDRFSLKPPLSETQDPAPDTDTEIKGLQDSHGCKDVAAGKFRSSDTERAEPNPAPG